MGRGESQTARKPQYTDMGRKGKFSGGLHAAGFRVRRFIDAFVFHCKRDVFRSDKSTNDEPLA
jgi:hypothetical protein